MLCFSVRFDDWFHNDHRLCNFRADSHLRVVHNSLLMVSSHNNGWFHNWSWLFSRMNDNDRFYLNGSIIRRLNFNVRVNNDC